MTTIVARYPALLGGIVIGFVAGAADLAGGGSGLRAATTVAIVLAYAVLVTVLGRRSETASALAGRPVDERWIHIDLEASKYAFVASAIVVLLAFLVADATGAEATPYALIAGVIAASYVGSLLILRARR